MVSVTKWQGLETLSKEPVATVDEENLLFSTAGIMNDKLSFTIEFFSSKLAKCSLV